MMLVATAAVACCALHGCVFLRIVGLPYRAFLGPISLNNVGNIGLSIAVLALGPEGLAYGLAYMVVVLLGIFTYGMWLPMGNISFKKILGSPVIYSVIIAQLRPIQLREIDENVGGDHLIFAV